MVPAEFLLAPPKVTVTMLSEAKPVPLRYIATPGAPWVGLMLTAAWSARAGVARIETKIKETPIEANATARAETDGEPVLRCPRRDMGAIAGI